MTAEELLADPGPVKLAAYRNAIIEECAVVADGFEEAEFGYNPTAVKIAAAIRALNRPPPYSVL